MRKFILILLLGLLFVSCESHNETTETTQIKGADEARHFEYNGHKYIMFYYDRGMSYDQFTGFVHDPDCPCHENNNQKIDGLW